MTPAELLDLAADRVEQRGLWKSGTTSPGTCANNAIWDSADSVDRYVDIAAVFAGHLGLTGEMPWALFDWNDAEHRSDEQVVKELRACAQTLRYEK